MTDYATLAELKAQLGITDTVDDTALSRVLTATSRAVDEHCGREFSQDAAAVARVYRAVCSDQLSVDDISTATGLLVATDENDDGTYETSWTISTDFLLEPSNALADGRPAVRLVAVGAKTFPTYGLRPAVQVTARYGWAAVPVQVTEATIIKAARLFRRKDTPEGVAGGGEFGVVRISNREDPDVAALLAPFVRGDRATGWGIG